MRARSRLKTLAVTILFVVACGIFLVACGGGGSSTPAKTTPAPETPAPETPAPEMTITPTAPTAEDIASAIDVTGQDTIEGSLDSDNPGAFYKIRIDEPSVLALRSEDDIDITVYDSAGHVVNPSTAAQAAVVPGAASAGGGGGHPEVSAAAATHPVFVLVRGTWIIRIERLRQAADGSTRFKVIFGLEVAELAPRGPLTLSIGVEKERELDLDENFDGEAATTATWTITPTITTTFGTLKLAVPTPGRTVRASHVPVRASHSGSDSEQCPTGTERRWTGEATLTASWTRSIPVLGERTLSQDFPIAVTVDSQAPRRKEGRPYEIAVTIQKGKSKTVNLADEIEDPQGGNLQFAARYSWSFPTGSGLSVTREGAALTMAAQDDGARGPPPRIFPITVTAIDPDEECWNFPVRVTVVSPQNEPPRWRSGSGLVVDGRRAETRFYEVPQPGSVVIDITKYFEDPEDDPLFVRDYILYNDNNPWYAELQDGRGILVKISLSCGFDGVKVFDTRWVYAINDTPRIGEGFLEGFVDDSRTLTLTVQTRAKGARSSSECD